MNIPQGYAISHDKEISHEEYEVINIFLEFYRNKPVIIADEYRQDFNLLPLEENITFKTYDDIFKSIDFRRKIYYKSKPYIVELGLCRNSHNEKEPKCLQIDNFKIIANGKVHFINFDLSNCSHRSILFNIISIFDEKKIISPEQAYCNQMYTNKVLQEFLTNHEWKNIDKGIQQMPSLANALFIIREGYKTGSHYTAEFATILYQLIAFRTHNIASLNKDEKDLDELDKLIIKLSRTNLLKVQLHEQTDVSKSNPTRSILLDYNYHIGKMHKSTQYNVDNTGLSIENSILKKLVKCNK
jgi:hypothetical protein